MFSARVGGPAECLVRAASGHRDAPVRPKSSSEINELLRSAKYMGGRNTVQPATSFSGSRQGHVFIIE